MIGAAGQLQCVRARASILARASLAFNCPDLGAGEGGRVASRGGLSATFTRATVAQTYNATGSLVEVASGAMRSSYDPSTLAYRGTHHEPLRTNSIRNNTMQGAVVGVIGSGGANPTNWGALTGSGLAQEVTSLSAVSGISTITTKVSGTTTATEANWHFESVAGYPAASPGQNWTHSLWFQVTNDDAAITDVILEVVALDAADAEVARVTSSLQAGRLTFQRSSVNYPSLPANTAKLLPRIRLVHANGASVTNYAFRIGLPQLESGSYVTSPIKTSGAAASRNDDLLRVNTLAPWFNQAEGTLVASVIWDEGLVANQWPGVGLCGAGNEHIGFFNNQATGQVLSSVRDAASVQQFNSTLQTGATRGTRSIVAVAYKANDFAGCANGGSVATDNAGTVPTITHLRLAQLDTILSGYLEWLRYFPFRMPNGVLQQITR